MTHYDTELHDLSWFISILPKHLFVILYAPTELCLSGFFLCVCVCSIFPSVKNSACKYLDGFNHNSLLCFIIASQLPLNIDQETHPHVLGTEQRCPSWESFLDPNQKNTGPRVWQIVAKGKSECSDQTIRVFWWWGGKATEIWETQMLHATTEVGNDNPLQYSCLKNSMDWGGTHVYNQSLGQVWKIPGEGTGNSIPLRTMAPHMRNDP